MSARCLASWFSMGLCALSLLATGCEPAATPAPVSIEVAVSPPVERAIVDYLDFTGRTQARDAVQLQARIGGYLEKINFTDGAEVKEGQVLFEIDDRVYRAQRDLALAEGKLAEARVGEARAEYQRLLALFRREAASREDLEKAQRSSETTQAALEEARDDLHQAE